MNINIITLFPEIFEALNFGLLGQAIDRQDIKINNLNYDTNISNLSEEVETAYIGGDPTSIAVKEKEIKDYIETSKARGIDKAVTQGDQLLKTLEEPLETFTFALKA